MFRLLLFIAMTLQMLHGYAGNDDLARFIAKGYVLAERVELNHGRTVLITRHKQPKGRQVPNELVLLDLSGEDACEQGRMPMAEGTIRCMTIDSCTFQVELRTKQNIIHALTFTYGDDSPCILDGYSQDYIIQYEPELWYGHLYHTPAGILFGEVTPELLGRIAGGTAERNEE